MFNLDRVIGTAACVLGLAASAGMAQVFAPAQTTNPTPANPVAPAGEPATPAAPVGAGRIIFISDAVETGEILDTEIATVEFKFRNVGPGPLTVTRVQPTCGCTVPEMEKTVFEPNEEGTITAKFDPKGMQGNVARSIQVFTDSIATPNVTINIRAYVKPVVLTMPKDMVNFESVNKGQETVREIRVFGRIPDFEVTRASTTEPLLYDVEVSKVGMTDVMGEMLPEYVIRVRLKKDAPPGQHPGTLTIRTNDERRAIFSMALMSNIVGDLEMSPVRMTLGRLAVGETFEREIRVRSRTAAAFEIKGVTLSNPAVSAEFHFEPVDPEVRNEWIVRANGVVKGAAPRFNAAVNILTDVRGEELTPFFMSGVLRPN